MSRIHRKFPTDTVLVFGMIAIFVGGLIFLAWYHGRRFANLTTRQLALTCTTDMATQFHIHPNLRIVVNGQDVTIPAGIGIKPGCMNSIHTHDASGKLHVEAPEKRDFTLADFFAVWNKPFTKDQILDNKVDSQHIIRLTVNGTESIEYENLVLRDDDQIVISYEEKK